MANQSKLIDLWNAVHLVHTSLVEAKQNTSVGRATAKLRKELAAGNVSSYGEVATAAEDWDPDHAGDTSGGDSAVWDRKKKLPFSVWVIDRDRNRTLEELGIEHAGIHWEDGTILKPTRTGWTIIRAIQIPEAAINNKWPVSTAASPQPDLATLAHECKVNDPTMGKVKFYKWVRNNCAPVVVKRQAAYAAHEQVFGKQPAGRPRNPKG